MDIKKVLEAHADMGKCLSGNCDHKTLSKCMDKIAQAHEAMGDELMGEAKKSLNKAQGDLILKKLEPIQKDDHQLVVKVLSITRSGAPTLVD